MARPFNIEPDPEVMRLHYLRIQDLLGQLMRLLRQMPSAMIGNSLGPPVVLNFIPSRGRQEPTGERHRLWLQQQRQNSENRQSVREPQQQRQNSENRPSVREPQQQQQNSENRPSVREPQQQQQSMLPDLVTSANPPPPPPPPPQQQEQQQLQGQQQQSAAEGEDRIAGAVKLQVAVCPTCYYGKDRKLKVIAVAKLDANGKPIRWTNRDDEEPLVVEDKTSKVKRRIMSLFQPSQIESSVLTAMFVIIGWKMFIRQ